MSYTFPRAINSADVVFADDVNNLRSATEEISTRDAQVFHVWSPAYGAVGNGVADDTSAIGLAVAAASAAVGSGNKAIVELKPGATYNVTRINPADQQSAGIALPKGVSLDGRGATLVMTGNTQFVKFVSPLTATVATITANVAIAATQFTVDSTTGFTAGDDVMVRLNDNAWDSAEVKDWYYAKVVSVDSSTLITLDRPAPAACTVASTASANKRITRMTNPIDGSFVRNLTLIDPRTGSANAESGIDIRYARNVVIENIIAEHPGAGIVIGGYVENALIRNISVRKSTKQSGQASKGRVFNIWNAKGVHIDGLYGENFQGTAIFCESYCRGVRFDNVHLVNNYASRTATDPLITIDQGSEAIFGNLIVEGNGGCPIFNEGGTTDNQITVDSLSVKTATQLQAAGLRYVTNALRIGATAYGNRVIRTILFRLDPSMAGVTISLPAGMYRRTLIYVTTLTGVSVGGIYLQNTTSGTVNAHSGLTAGQLTLLAGASDFGSNTPFNDYAPKQVVIYTDGTVPAGSWGLLQIDYWPTADNDVSKGRLLYLGNPPTYSPTNVTIDRSYDANSTTLDEVADVLGTLIADLKLSGWIQ